MNKGLYSFEAWSFLTGTLYPPFVNLLGLRAENSTLAMWNLWCVPCLTLITIFDKGLTLPEHMYDTNKNLHC